MQISQYSALKHLISLCLQGIPHPSTQPKQQVKREGKGQYCMVDSNLLPVYNMKWSASKRACINK